MSSLFLLITGSRAGSLVSTRNNMTVLLFLPADTGDGFRADQSILALYVVIDRIIAAGYLQVICYDGFSTDLGVCTAKNQELE